MLLHSLWLAERPNISDGLKAALLRQFSSPEELYYCRESELAALEMGGMTPEALEALGDKSLDGAEKTLETCLKGGVSFLTPEDPKYPDRLRALYDAPVLLLDEPFRALDAALRARVIACIAAETQGRTLVLATHDAADAAALGCAVYAYADGAFRRDG